MITGGSYSDGVERLRKQEERVLRWCHWGIENRLHWALDVTRNEDQARNRKGYCAENLALLRKLALNLARLEPSKGSMRGKLIRAGWDGNFFINILSQFANIHMR